MLQVVNVQKQFGSKIAVDNLSFEINRGEILGLLGTNGAGKTTTFRMILGIFKPDSGRILLDGKDISIDDSNRIGFLPEERSLLPKYTIAEQLYFFGELKGKTRGELEPKIDHWLSYFELTDNRDSKIKELSKGNQQKVQFISSILHEPDLVILDEPFSGLDPINIKLIAEAIKSLTATGTMIIFSSHRLDYVESFSKDVIFLEKGVPLLEGNIDEIKRAGNEYIVEVESLDDLHSLEQVDFIISITNDSNLYKIKIDSYQNIDQLFSLLSAMRIRKFDVKLPSLEDLVINAVRRNDEEL
ncbi:ATP-binding cassette domain-containing protein [Mollicutes bacterium LVI A0078]|nr:ATP-binding cassette domain-containing protein [Mollicutes bacterium LVI A0075]WOO90712.1 ATP-binding cassette domain-containing protein [Mollicutes bacterium LVI A0078]